MGWRANTVLQEPKSWPRVTQRDFALAALGYARSLR